MHAITYYTVLLHAGILTVGAMEACGFNPCFEKACKVDLTARCVSDSDCRPTFISKTQRILDECVGKQKFRGNDLTLAKWTNSLKRFRQS